MSGDDKTPAQAALRYVAAHPAVKIVLSGMSEEWELAENISAFEVKSAELPADRIARVDGRLRRIEGFCTGCRYCDGCPAGIDIFAVMQARNASLFPYPSKLYGRTEPEIMKTMVICQRLRNTFGILPESSKNPCIGCGRCEERCTAHLPIIESLKEIFERFEESCFGRRDMLRRLREIIGEKRKIAFYPGGGYTAYVVGMLEEAFPEEKFSLSVYDSNPAIWGNVTAGHEVQNPSKIMTEHPDLVIVSNYKYGEEIYDDLVTKFRGAIQIVKLHKKMDVPWSF